MHSFFCTLSPSNLQYLTTATNISSAPEPLIQKIVNMEWTIKWAGSCLPLQQQSHDIPGRFITQDVPNIYVQMAQWFSVNNQNSIM